MALATMPRPGRRTRGHGHRVSLSLLLAAVALLFGAWLGLRPAFQPVPANRQNRPPRVRNNLPQTLEVVDEEPEPEPEPVPEEPPHRIPYSFHLTSHMPGHKHLKEETAARLMIEKKIINALKNTEDLITHVNARLEVSENYHKPRDSRKNGRNRATTSMEAGATEDELDSQGADFLPRQMEVDDTGAKQIAPYHLEVTVNLKNGRSVILSRPKHAMPTLREAADHTADALRTRMHEQKDLWLRQTRHPKNAAKEGVDMNDIPRVDEVEAEIASAFTGRDEQELDERYTA